MKELLTRPSILLYYLAILIGEGLVLTFVYNHLAPGMGWREMVYGQGVAILFLIRAATRRTVWSDEALHALRNIEYATHFTAQSGGSGRDTADSATLTRIEGALRALYNLEVLKATGKLDEVIAETEARNSAE